MNRLPDPAAELLRQFSWDLQLVRREAGGPSYHSLVRRNPDLSETTISRLLNGTYKPTWNAVEAFLKACRVPEPEFAMWKTRWVELMSVLEPIGSTRVGSDHQGPANPLPSSIGCDRCGLVIADPVLHEKWHNEIELRVVSPRDRLRVVRGTGKPSARTA